MQVANCEKLRGTLISEAYEVSEMTWFMASAFECKLLDGIRLWSLMKWVDCEGVV